MSIKAVFSDGQDSISVRGLFQWDYGVVLEIEATDIGTEIVEAHFACANMSEAIVRSCSFSNGFGTVTIPDSCLEQTSDIKVWIYKILGTQGYTIKTITLPIRSRARPSFTRDIPQVVQDKYTELITEVNEAIDNLESGNVTAGNAKTSEKADYAFTAGNASSAAYASSAGSAEVAGSANEADKLSSDWIHYNNGDEVDVKTNGYIFDIALEYGKTYLFRAKISSPISNMLNFILTADTVAVSTASLYFNTVTTIHNGIYLSYGLHGTSYSPGITIHTLAASGESISLDTTVRLSYKEIC